MTLGDTLFIEVDNLSAASASASEEDGFLLQHSPTNADRSFWRSAARGLAAACFVCAGAVILLQPQDSFKKLEDRDLSALTPTTQIDQCNDVGFDPLYLNVVSYNLFWWCVSDQYRNCQANADGAGFDKLYERIKLNHPFDLIGLQECNDVKKIVHNTGYADCLDYYQPPVKEGNDVAQAWNKNKYRKISEGTEVVAADRYGKRRVNFVRLEIRMGGTIFFANTHGPLEQCAGENGRKIGDAYVEVINKYKHKDDLVVFTGDFNCGQFTDTMKQLNSRLSQAAVGNSYDGADHIYTNGLKVLSKASVKGEPSDHQLLKASFQLPVQQPIAARNRTEVLSGLTVTSDAVEKKSIPIKWNVAPSQTIAPSMTTTAEPAFGPVEAVLGAATELRNTVYVAGAVVLALVTLGICLLYFSRRSGPASNRSMRKEARRSHPQHALSPSKTSVREDVFSPERIRSPTTSTLEESLEESIGYDTPRTGSVFDFGQSPPMATPERPVDRMRQLQEACVENGQLEVFSKSLDRWMIGTVVSVKGEWVVAEYAAPDGSVRRSNVQLSADDVHERIRALPGV